VSPGDHLGAVRNRPWWQPPARNHATAAWRARVERQVASLFGDGQALAEGRRHVSELVETRRSLRRVSSTRVNQYHDQQEGRPDQPWGQLSQPYLHGQPPVDIEGNEQRCAGLAGGMHQLVPCPSLDLNRLSSGSRPSKARTQMSGRAGSHRMPPSHAKNGLAWFDGINDGR
jgi:hypothetical protein